MSNTLSKVGADDPRACRGFIRAILLSLPLLVSFSLALVPMSVKVDNSGVYVHRCEALANPAVVAGASEFIAECAAASGLSSSEFVATVVGAAGVSSGCVIASDQGVKMGNSLSQNLDSLAEAADYPAYETLTSEQQQSWGSKDNYQSAKFNSLMDAFGLDTARDRFYASGGNFEFESDEQDKLSRLGRIGSNWASGASNVFDDVYDSVMNKNSVFAYMGITPEVSTEDTGLNIPEGIYSSIAGAKQSSCAVRFTTQNWFNKTTTDCVFCYYTYTQNGKTVPAVINCAKVNYGSGWKKGSYPDWEIGNNAEQATVNGQTFYYGGNNFSSNYPQLVSVDVPKIGELSRQLTSVQNQAICYLLLFGDYQGETNLPGYPSIEINPTTAIYYPAEVTPETPWNDYLTQPEQPPAPIDRPETPYNPDNQTGNSDWKQETTKNVLPLQNIRFDKLFPFCLMNDVQRLTEKIQDTVEPGEQSDYLRISIPMAYASNDQGLVSEDVDLDGTPVHDLLLMVRPFNQILLLFLMVFSLVMFWKSILTGD